MTPPTADDDPSGTPDPLPADTGHRSLTVTSGIALIVATVAVIGVVTAAIHPWYAHRIAGTATAAQYVSTGDTTVTVERLPTASEDPRGAPHTALVAAIMTDVTAFWSQAFPTLTDRAFTPLRGGVTAIDSAVATESTPCVSTPSRLVGNAFFCPANDGIVYDSAALVPVLLHRYGPGGLVSTFAHEFGHAIQARMTSDSPPASSESGSKSGSTPLTRELQADCYAGAFWEWVITGHADHIHLDKSVLLDAIGPLADFADPPGVAPSDPTAHGRAINRAGQMLRGLRHGVTGCDTVPPDTIRDGSTNADGSDDDAPVATPRYDSRAAALTAAARSVGRFIDGHTNAAVPPAALTAVAAYGQFAQATLLAFSVGMHRSATTIESPASESPTAAVSTAGSPSAAPPSIGSSLVDAQGVHAACFAGAWVGSVYGDAAAGALGSWPGDVDAGLAAIRHRPGATFAELTGYVDGVRHGLASCRGR